VSRGVKILMGQKRERQDDGGCHFKEAINGTDTTGYEQGSGMTARLTGRGQKQRDCADLQEKIGDAWSSITSDGEDAKGNGNGNGNEWQDLVGEVKIDSRRKESERVYRMSRWKMMRWRPAGD